MPGWHTLGKIITWMGLGKHWIPCFKWFSVTPPTTFIYVAFSPHSWVMWTCTCRVGLWAKLSEDACITFAHPLMFLVNFSTYWLAYSPIKEVLHSYKPWLCNVLFILGMVTINGAGPTFGKMLIFSIFMPRSVRRSWPLNNLLAILLIFCDAGS